NIVHRDFKADNVWVDKDGRARVLDFGLARATRAVGEEQQSPDAVPGGDEEKRSVDVPLLGTTVTQPGSFLGTPPYMAPEPLKSLSGDPQQDYFVDGMTEALITELGKISALQVLSYQSTARYRQAALPLSLIARELKVDAFLEGAMLYSGSRVRITAKLVQASPERQIWGETYEFDRRDVLGIQGEVARGVSSRIRVKVTPSELRRLTTSRPVDSEAYEAYLLGRALLSKTQTATNWKSAK